jgi:hypothetical protein
MNQMCPVPCMFYKRVKSYINITFCPSRKRQQETKRYIASYQAKKFVSFVDKNNEDFSIDFANLFEGGLDYSDALINLFQNY